MKYCRDCRWFTPGPENIWELNALLGHEGKCHHPASMMVHLVTGEERPPAAAEQRRGRWRWLADLRNRCGRKAYRFEQKRDVQPAPPPPA